MNRRGQSADLGYKVTGSRTAAEIDEVLESLPPAFTTIWSADHLQFGDQPRHEGWTLIAFLAARHPRFQFGHMVLSQSFRNPALLAKMAATLQSLTGGRFILGLGAGWAGEEYGAYGYEFPTGGVRVRQLREYIQLIRALWSESPASFAGEFYRIAEAYCEPLPDPSIPILVGTKGPKALRVTAELADAWNWDAPWEAYVEPHDTLRAHCEEIGRPFEEITLTAEATLWFPSKREEFKRRDGDAAYIGPTPEEAVRDFQEMIDRGVTHIELLADDDELKRFADEALPHLRLGA